MNQTLKPRDYFKTMNIPDRKKFKESFCQTAKVKPNTLMIWCQTNVFPPYAQIALKQLAPNQEFDFTPIQKPLKKVS